MDESGWITPYPSRSQGRRPFQFSLRTLFVVTTALAVVAAVTARWGLAGVVVPTFVIMAAGSLFLIGRGLVQFRVEMFVIGFFALLGVFLLSIPVFVVAIWDGSKAVPLQFVVVDSTSGKSIPAATVRLLRSEFDLRIAPGGASKQITQGTTQSNGSVTLTETFPCSGHSGFLENYGFVCFPPDYWLQVSAAGFRSDWEQLATLTGKRRDIDDPIPPPMQIELNPVSATNNK